MTDPQQELPSFREAVHEVAEAVSAHLAANPTGTVTTSIVDGEGQVHGQWKDLGPGAVFQPKDALIIAGEPTATTRGRKAGSMSVAFSSNNWNSPWEPGSS